MLFPATLQFPEADLNNNFVATHTVTCTATVLDQATCFVVVTTANRPQLNGTATIAVTPAGATPELDSSLLFGAGALGLAGLTWRQRRSPAA